MFPKSHFCKTDRTIWTGPQKWTGARKRTGPIIVPTNKMVPRFKSIRHFTRYKKRYLLHPKNFNPESTDLPWRLNNYLFSRHSLQK